MSSEVPKGWQLKTFGEIAKVKNGCAFKSADFTDLESDSVLVIRMSDLKNGSISKQSAKRVPENIVSGLERFKLQRGDFVFGMSGSLRNYAVVPDSSVPMYLNQRVGKLEATVSDTEFLRYLYTSEKFISNVEKSASGNAQLNISGKLIESFEVLLPPLTEQKRIAEVLNSVDESIQATQRLIEQAERVKQGLMEELLTGGLGSEAIERGEVPEGWEIGPIGKLACVKNGFAFKSKDFLQDDLDCESVAKVVRMSDFNGAEINLDRCKSIAEKGTEKLIRFQLNAGDIVIAMSGATVGKLGIMPKAPEKTYLNQRVGCFEPKSGDVGFLWNVLRSPNFRNEIIKLATGNAQPNISAKQIESVLIPIPTLAEQTRIADVLSSVDDRVKGHKDELGGLSRLKKGLMDDLLTGKVRTV